MLGFVVARAVRPVPRVHRGAALEDPGPRRLAAVVRGRRRRARPRPAARGGAIPGRPSPLDERPRRTDGGGARGACTSSSVWTRSPARWSTRSTAGSRRRCPSPSTTRPLPRKSSRSGAERVEYVTLSTRGAAAQAHLHVRCGGRRRAGRAPARAARRRTPSRKLPRSARAPRALEGPARRHPWLPLASPRVHLSAIKLRGFKSFPTRWRSGSSPAWPWSSGRTAPGSRTSRTGSSGRPVRCSVGAPRREARRRPLRRLARAEADRLLRGRLLFDNSDGDGPVDYSSSRSHGACTAVARAVPRQPGGRAADRPRRAARRPRARWRHALDHRPGQGRGGTRLVSREAARDDRGGRGARAVQAAAPPRRTEAPARRDPGRARAHVEAGGQEAAAAARAPGDRGRARREARRGDRVARARIAQLDLDALGTGWPRARSGEPRPARAAPRQRTARGAARRAERRRGGANRRGGQARSRPPALSPAQLRRASDAAARVDRVARAVLPSATETFTDGAELRRAAADPPRRLGLREGARGARSGSRSRGPARRARADARRA